MDQSQNPEKNIARPTGGSGGARLVREPWIQVLHIDDDCNDRELLVAATLEAEVPLQIHSVSDADQAIAFLTGTGPYANRSRFRIPNLIILDLKLPRAGGIDILRWIRAHPQLNQIPVMVLSGSESEEDKRQAYAFGANAYVIKPLGFSALVDIIKNLNSAWLPQNAAPQINYNLSRA